MSGDRKTVDIRVTGAGLDSDLQVLREIASELRTETKAAIEATRRVREVLAEIKELHARADDELEQALKIKQEIADFIEKEVKSARLEFKTSVIERLRVIAEELDLVGQAQRFGEQTGKAIDMVLAELDDVVKAMQLAKDHVHRITLDKTAQQLVADFLAERLQITDEHRRCACRNCVPVNNEGLNVIKKMAPMPPRR